MHLLLNSKSPNVFQHWKSSLAKFPISIRDDLFNRDTWTDNLIFTDTARVIVGSLPLVGFSRWMRSALQARIQSLKDGIKLGIKHRAWLEIEAQRQESILKSTLYLFEFQLDDKSIIHKVGRTLREPEKRINETSFDLEKATHKKVIKSRVLRIANNSGFIEKYVFHRYKNNLAKIGTLTEYLIFDDKTLKQLKAEFTNVANNVEPFNKSERFIIAGRWKYEDKRLIASKRGINLTIKENGKFGRPKHSKMSENAFLEKHSDIVNLLERGESLKKTADITGKGLSTVKRVKAVTNKTR